MVKSDALITTRAHDYSKPSASEKGKEAEIPSLPLHIEKTLGETMTHIPKGLFKRASHNPNTRATQNYSVVEDLSQTPCAMSALEVLQSCLTQRKALLTSLGSIETCNPGTIMLDMTDLKPRLPYHIAFQIVVAQPTKTFTWNIFCTMVDEGASTCVMSLACWKAIGQPELSPSPTLLTVFDGRSFRPHGIIPSFPVQLGGKTVCVEVEVVDAPIYYNLLLGRSWTYSMQAVVATVFRVLLFPHEGRIVTIDQLSFSQPYPTLGASMVPMIDNPQASVVNIGVGLCPYLMGTFDYPPPHGDVKFISTHHKAEIFHISSFRTTYFQDLWILPSPSATMDETGHAGMSMPLSTTKVAYSLVQQTSTTPYPTPAQELDPLLEPVWAQGSLATTDSLDLVLPFDEVVIEEMTSPDRPWEDLHHRSYFLPELSRIEAGEFNITMTEDQPCPINLLATQEIYAEGNMETITATIPINISRNPGVVENVFVGADCSPEEIQIYMDLFKEFCDVFAWSYEEMPGINPKIVEHEITTYPDAKPVRKKLHPVNPRKEAAIKAEVEKLLKAGFIYPIHLTQWVSNPVLIDKKQGTIQVCTDFWDLKEACPKYNYPTPFIDQIIDECIGCEAFLFMDGFSGYNQIQIKPEDQHKTTFICPWGTFAYRKMPFGLKNVGATFQWAMSFVFHDLKHIVEAYLDDLASCSRKRKDHPMHLRLIFECCRYFRIRLNPNKCSFCVTSGHLLDFIVSTTGIMVDPLKVEAIVQFPPPRTILQLQSLQGKANFLRHFMANYAEITKGFMRLLKKDVPFFWDEAAQRSFDALKHALTTAPLLRTPNYNKDFLLYLAIAKSTIGMVLVQEDDSFSEYVIYYLSRGLVGPELNYSHLEKLVLAAIHVVQWFRHYVLFRKTTVVAIVNPFQYMLTRRFIGGKISRWMVILQEFDLDFVSAKSKKSLVFAELISELSVESGDVVPEESPIRRDMFLIESSDPWYRDILIYL
jgi:hypothetical protein